MEPSATVSPCAPEAAQAPRPDALRALCAQLRLPAPAARACLHWAGAPETAPLLRYVPALLEPVRAEAAGLALREACAALDADGFAELAVLLSAALAARERFSARGIPDSVYLDTMGCFARFLNETHGWTGRWRFDRGFWVWRQLSGRLLRLGTLEFELLPLPEPLAAPLGAAAGTAALSVHIPGDAVCTPEQLHASYRQRARFFGDGGRPPLTYCRTWLLSPRVQTLLAPGAGLWNFARDYALAGWDPRDNSGRQWLFGAPDVPDDALPERTSLQRAVKPLLLRGCCIGSGLGWLREQCCAASGPRADRSF